MAENAIAEAVVEELTSFEVMLLRLLDHLTWVRQCDDAGSGSMHIVWDWEMVQEAIYPTMAKSVFSSVLWYGLECLASCKEDDEHEDENWRIVLTEGSRRELVNHFTGLASKYRRSERNAKATTKKINALLGQDSSFQRHADWKDFVAELATLAHADEAIDRVLLLLRDYVRPAPFQSTDIPQEKLDYYSSRMEKSRPHKKTNQADALNLASVDEMQAVLSDAEGSCAVSLITATGAVQKAAPNIARDPFFFVFFAEFRRRYPTQPRRRNAIYAMTRAILERLVLLGRHSADPPEARIRRAQVEQFLRELKLLHDDPILAELGGLLSKSLQAVENANYQARALSESICLPSGPNSFKGFRNFVNKISTLLVALGVDTNSSESFGLKNKRVDLSNGLARYFILGAEDQQLIELERCDPHLTLRWTTEGALNEFSDALRWLSETLGCSDCIRLRVRLPQTTGTLLREIQDFDKFPTSLRSVCGDKKLLLLIVDIGDYRVWYEPRDIWHPDRADPASFLARISMRIGISSDLGTAAQMYERTASEWMHWEAIAKSIEDLPNAFATEEPVSE